MKPVVYATSDIFVRYLFGSEGNRDLLLSFLNAIQEASGFAHLVSVSIKNPFNLKKIRLDTRMEDSMMEGRIRGLAEGRKAGRAEGRAEGRTEGRTEGRVEVAKRMLERGMSVEDIRDLTGMGEEEIRKLKLD